MASNAVVCIECERVALLRTAQTLGDLIYDAKNDRKAANMHMIDKNGFVNCRQDTLFFTYCWNCELARESRFGLRLDVRVTGTNHVRLTNPYISSGFLRRWHLLEPMARILKTAARLSTNTNARPVLKIEFLTAVWNIDMSNRVEVAYVGKSTLFPRNERMCITHPDNVDPQPIRNGGKGIQQTRS